MCVQVFVRSCAACVSARSNTNITSLSTAVCTVEKSLTAVRAATRHSRTPAPTASTPTTVPPSAVPPSSSPPLSEPVRPQRRAHEFSLGGKIEETKAKSGDGVWGRGQQPTPIQLEGLAERCELPGGPDRPIRFPTFFSTQDGLSGRYPSVAEKSPFADVDEFCFCLLKTGILIFIKMCLNFIEKYEKLSSFVPEP